MTSVPLTRFLSFSNDVLEIPICPEKVSYLYVEGSKNIERVCFALDVTEGAVEFAAKEGVDLLVTHHPITYGPIPRISGAVARKVRKLLANDISLYSAHLPLDAVFNGPVLAERLGIKVEGRFAYFDGFEAGVYGTTDPDTFHEALAGMGTASLHMADRGVRRVGVVTGSGAKGHVVAEAQSLGLDTLVTGERSYHGLLSCEEAGLNVVFLGHYDSELPGLLEFMRKAEKELGITGIPYTEEREY